MEKHRTVGVGIIGLGARAETLIATIRQLPEIRISAICDVRPERVERILAILAEHSAPRPAVYADCRELIGDADTEAVLVPTGWNSHLAIARECMKHGKYAGIEVGGASSTEELWQLVHAAESTGVSCMMLENCCYGRDELMVLNMVRQGIFGELVYCECGYEHDLSEMGYRTDNRIERSLHNRFRNGDLYPTHGVGPIAKILRINRGNRFLTISSHATKARGFAAARAEHTGKPSEIVFNEGDIVTSVIHCANGENITLTHGVSLPRPYSRDYRVQGTRGIWLADAKGIYVEGRSPKFELLDVAGNPYWEHKWDPIDKYREEFDHPIWREYAKTPVGGHGGMDALALRAFLDAVVRRVTPPIDVYDCAAWMSITCLSEQSIAMGGMPVPFPDFTNGKWLDRTPEAPSRWSLDEVYS